MGVPGRGSVNLGGCLITLFLLGGAFALFGPLALILLPTLFFPFLATSRRGPAGAAGGWTGTRNSQQYDLGQVRMSVLVLLAAMMRADGQVLRSELDYVKRFLVSSYGEQEAATMLLTLRDILKQPLPLQQACNTLRMMLQPSGRLAFLSVLMGLAQADGVVTPSERSLLEQIRSLLGVAAQDYSRTYSRYSAPETDYYAVLGLTREASNEEIRKAYRQLLIKWHPDRQDKSPEAQALATKKMQQINAAYEKIKAQRGLK